MGLIYLSLSNLDTIESNIERASGNVESGTGQLERAAAYQVSVPR